MKKLVTNPSFHFFLLTGIAMSLPVFRPVGNLFIILSFLVALYIFVKKKIDFKIITHPILIFPLLFFGNIFINGLFGYNANEFLRQIDKNILTLIIPFSILLLFKKSFFQRILKFFNYSLLLVTIILLINNIVKLAGQNLVSSLFFHDFTSLVNENAVYFSLFLSFGILISLVELKKNKNIKINKLNLFVFSLGLLFCASKALIFITTLLVFFLLFTIFKKSFKKIMIFSVAILMIVITMIKIPYLKDRFMEGLHFDIQFVPTNQLKDAKVFTNSEIDLISDLELRLIFLKIGVYHVINDDKWLFGYGVSDYQDYLDYYYMYYGLAPFHYEGYSPHNQYVYSFVSSGLIGFLLFLTYLYYSFYKSYRGKDYLYLVFLILFCFSMIFETYLLRTKGIIFFFFFNSLFLIYNQKYENRHIRK